jgi:hypothetical protein
METFRFLHDDLRIVASVYSIHPGNKLNVPVVRLLPGVTQNTGFSDFNAKRIHSGVFLKWKVNNPQKDDTFYIFRNTLDHIFEKIGLIQLEGLTGEQDQFVYIDTHSPETDCYYRIERYRFDHLLAKSETAQIDAIHKRPFVSFQVYTEPVKEAIRIQLYASAKHPIIISLFDDSNTLLFQRPVAAETGMNQYSIHTNNLPPGNYLVTFDYAGCTETVKKIIQVIK